MCTRMSPPPTFTDKQRDVGDCQCCGCFDPVLWWGTDLQGLNKLQPGDGPADTPVDAWYRAGMISDPEIGFYFVRDEDAPILGASE